MDYNKILEHLSKNVKFSKYDAFSTEKKCHYINFEGIEYALLWQTVEVDKMNETLDNLMEMLSWHSKEHIKPNNEYYFIPMSDTKLAFKNNINKIFNRLSEFTKATNIEYIYNII